MRRQGNRSNLGGHSGQQIRPGVWTAHGSTQMSAQSLPHSSLHSMSSGEGVESSLVAHSVTWDSFGLDPRLTRAVQKLGWSNPTLVQSASIPRVLQGASHRILYRTSRTLSVSSSRKARFRTHSKSCSRCNSTLANLNSTHFSTLGKDVLAKARTGSGKTAAYAVPLIQKILSEKEVRSTLRLHYSPSFPLNWSLYI